jgi:hypothetical protein
MPYVIGGGPQKDSGLPAVADVYRSNNVYVNNVPVALWDQPGPTSAIIGNIYIPDNPYQPAFVAELIAVSGVNGPDDDEFVETAPGVFTEKSTVEELEAKYQSTDGTAASTTSTAITSTSTVSTGTATQCGDFATPINYDQSLSTNFKIKDLSISTLFPHNIVAQNGFTVPDILCNLKAVAENILEPLRAKYPGFRINSGFRKGPGSSQHNKGMSIDVQWPGKPPRDYTEIGQWVAANLPFDQLIFEHGNSIWLHISYDRSKTTQRNQKLTYYTKAQPNYKPGLTNYYA